METKFIGLEGFNEIESLSTTKRKPNSVKRNQSKLNKTVRFAKRASAELGRAVAKKSSKAVVTIKNSSKKDRFKNSSSVLDRCYRENRNGVGNQLSRTVHEAVEGITVRNVPKYAHSTVNAKHSFLKRKAVVTSVACAMAAVFSCMTVVGAQSFDPASPKNYSQFVDQSGINLAAATAGSNAELLYSSSNSEVPMALAADSTNCGYGGLYIDGQLIGVTSERKALDEALDKVLVDYRADYDDETTTEFANNVEVKGGSYDDAEIMSVEDIMAAAKDKLSISLSTDMYYTQEIPYDTKVEYDESQPLSYEQVKTEGENGEEKVIVRVTLVDGVQVDAVQKDVEVTKEAVDKVVVKGGNESQNANYNPSSGGASSTGSGSFMWPMPYTHNITSEFGWRWGRLHGGVDIAAGGIYGQPIVAADSGVVTHSGNDGLGYGNYVVIDHGNGYETYYAHCSSLAVSVGQTVAQGQTVGYVGSTGNSTGPHLHFEIRVNGVQTNPLGYVS